MLESEMLTWGKESGGGSESRPAMRARIAVDAMGGDHAPDEIVAGAGDIISSPWIVPAGACHPARDESCQADYLPVVKINYLTLQHESDTMD